MAAQPSVQFNSGGQLSAGIVPHEPPRQYAPPHSPDVGIRGGEYTGRDKFAGAPENAFKAVRETPVSTFSIDVDTASYSFMRASLNRGVLPQPASVRTEELINYFPYDYAPPCLGGGAVPHQRRGVPESVDRGPQAHAHRHQGLCAATCHAPAAPISCS